MWRGISSLSLIVLLMINVSPFITSFSLIPGNGQLDSSNVSANSINATNKLSANSSSETKNFGAWWSYQLPLESIKKTEQKAAIETLLNQGYSEYYFPITDFSSRIYQINCREPLIYCRLYRSENNNDITSPFGRRSQGQL